MNTHTGAAPARDICLEILALPRAVRRTIASGQRFRIPPDSMITVVESGLLCRSSDLEGRARFVTEVYARGSFLEASATGGGSGDRPWEIVATIGSSVLQVPFGVFHDECRRSPTLAATTAAAWRRQHEILTERLAILVRRSPLERVAAALLFLAHRIGAPADSRTSNDLPLTQELIAATADMARQTVNRTLGELSDQSLLIARRRRVSLCDMDALRLLAQGSPRPAPALDGRGTRAAAGEGSA